MNTNNQAVDELPDHVRGLAQGARALMAATSEMGGDTVESARKRVGCALEAGKSFFGEVHDKVVQEARDAEASAHRHPYQVIGLALGLGALLGVLIMQRR